MAKKRTRRRKPVRAKSRRSVKSTRTPRRRHRAPSRWRRRVRWPRCGHRSRQEAPKVASSWRRRRRSAWRGASSKRNSSWNAASASRLYKATLAIMKKRGVKGLAPRAVKGGRAPKTAARPLQAFAEGDSWFDYPVPFFGGGIIPRLEDKLGVPILNLAKGGRSGALHAGCGGAQDPDRAVHQRLSSGRAVGRDALLGRRQRHRRQQYVTSVSKTTKHPPHGHHTHISTYCFLYSRRSPRRTGAMNISSTPSSSAMARPGIGRRPSLPASG